MLPRICTLLALTRQRPKTAGLRCGFEELVEVELESASARAFLGSPFHRSLANSLWSTRTCLPLPNSFFASIPITDHARLYLADSLYTRSSNILPVTIKGSLLSDQTFAESPEISTERRVRLPRHATRRRRQNSDRPAKEDSEILLTC